MKTANELTVAIDKCQANFHMADDCAQRALDQIEDEPETSGWTYIERQLHRTKQYIGGAHFYFEQLLEDLFTFVEIAKSVEAMADRRRAN